MIEIVNLHKYFRDKKVLRGVDLTINDGETLAIIGPSGCGKSVLLKNIVRLLEPDNGKVIIDGKDISELSQKELYQLRIKFGFLFQSAALFDSMTVEENISLPLLEHFSNLSAIEIKKAVAEKLEMVGLPGTEQLKPSELSGGMKKRVGLARALITNPSYILYDEPTTGLDPIMSDSIDLLIKKLNEQLSVTSIIVTHDMFSVKNVADRIVMLHEGKVYFQGNPDELLNTDDKIVSDFIRRTGF